MRNDLYYVNDAGRQPEHRTALYRTGDTVTLELPATEACMHMRLTGLRLPVTIRMGRTGCPYAEIHPSGDPDRPGPNVTVHEAGLIEAGPAYIVNRETQAMPDEDDEYPDAEYDEERRETIELDEYDREDGVTIVGKMADVLEEWGATEWSVSPGPVGANDWATSEAQIEDYTTGDYVRYSVHFYGLDGYEIEQARQEVGRREQARRDRNRQDA